MKMDVSWRKAVFLALAALPGARLPAGGRPYEMVWANRAADDHPPLLALTDPAGWRVECRDAAAAFTRSTDELLFGDAVCKLTYRAAGPAPSVTLSPPAPAAVTGAFDAVTCWIYGNNNSWAPDPETPPVTVSAQFTDAAGAPFSVDLAHIHHKEWFLFHRRLSDEQVKRVENGGAFRSFTITGGRNKADRVLYFNSLAVFKEEFAPLTFKPRAGRGVRVFSDAPRGLNTGPGRLPFPNTPMTVIPRDPAPSPVRAERDKDGRFSLVREGEDGRLEITLPDKAGDWDALGFRWNGSPRFPAAWGGGIYFAPDAAHPKPWRAPDESVAVRADGDGVLYEGALRDGGAVLSHVEMRARLAGKSLVLDVRADGGRVAEIRFGAPRGLPAPGLIPIPYYTYGNRDAFDRPCAIATSLAGKPFFLLSTMDWTQSNASEPFCSNIQFDGTLACNGGVRYFPKTDGRRNGCFERFVFSFSPEFDQILPNIPNPASPWKAVAGARVWRAHGAGNRESDAAYWRGIRRLGMKNIIVTDHETGWRDGNESFTFRTAPAPKKGGDAGQFRYARIMQDELGFVYGPYNNFTDFAPVNEFWNVDMVSRNRENQLQHAWARCYAPKPARAVEFCEKLAPAIERKFGFSTAYCDVHTCVAPWWRTDYDARVPGAGAFASTFYAFGEIMLLQKAAWGGPVYSEGGLHFMYCGLTDGNYAQDQHYFAAGLPWLVDFDLLRMHPLCCNFGMGDDSMFYPGDARPSDPQAAADRFLAATVAFGHPGFLLHGRAFELQSYFMIQALAARYTQAGAASIRYADRDGRLFRTSDAIANGCYRRSQILTRYTDGTVTAVNGSGGEPFPLDWEGERISLPPDGFCGKSADGKVRVFSGRKNGRRADLSVSPDYVYVNGRGRFASFAEGGCDGILIRLPEAGGTEEIILHGAGECALPYGVAAAVALDRGRKVIGPVETRVSRGRTYLVPDAKAVSYRVTPAGGKAAAPAVLSSAVLYVAPGETVLFTGKREHRWTVPRDAGPGAHLWREAEGGRIDFIVRGTPPPPPPPQTKRGAPRLPGFYIRGMARRGKAEEPLDSASGAAVYSGVNTCGSRPKKGLFMHPPYQKGVGYSFAKYGISLPDRPMAFRCQVGKGDGSVPGDGILFQIWVEAAGGRRTLLAEKLVTGHAWHPVGADLSAWRNQSVSLILLTDVGKQDDSAGDWGAWAELELTDKEDEG